jgi:uncharacterized metal-binding protein
MKQKCSNQSNSVLIFPCSGASDVGELADRVARRMTRNGLGKMFCLTAISGHVQQYVDDTQAAKDIIIIDGCSNECAKKTLSTINVQKYELNLERIGFSKGDSPATGININKVVNYIEAKIR